MTPEQFPFVTNELIPRMTFVPDWKLGPPESPKQVPPLSPVGFAESFRNSGASLRPLTEPVGEPEAR